MRSSKIRPEDIALFDLSIFKDVSYIESAEGVNLCRLFVRKVINLRAHGRVTASDCSRNTL